jgi:hypothetical protein
MLTKVVVLLHDNALPHTAARTNALTKPFNWNIFNQPGPGAKRLPSLHQDEVLAATQHFHNNEELIDGVNKRLHNLAAPLCGERLQKLMSLYDKCLNVDGNYVEK